MALAQRPSMLCAGLVLLASGCISPRGQGCASSSPCPLPFVCASTSSAELRRCLLPCGETTVPGVMVGELCGDGSVCRDSDVGPVCYFAGQIPIGAACPDPSCDPRTTVCDCEPGTICSDGACRQVCGTRPADCTEDLVCPDAEVAFGCAAHEICTRDHVCRVSCVVPADCRSGVCIASVCR